jgi:hypothetical protein
MTPAEAVGWCDGPEADDADRRCLLAAVRSSQSAIARKLCSLSLGQRLVGGVSDQDVAVREGVTSA